MKGEYHCLYCDEPIEGYVDAMIHGFIEHSWLPNEIKERLIE